MGNILIARIQQTNSVWHALQQRHLLHNEYNNNLQAHPNCAQGHCVQAHTDTHPAVHALLHQLLVVEQHMARFSLTGGSDSAAQGPKWLKDAPANDMLLLFTQT